MEKPQYQEMLDALLESEAQKRAIVEGFSGILIFFDRQMKAQWINRTTDCRQIDAIGKSCHEIFCSRGDRCKACAFRKCLETAKIESTRQRTGIFGVDGDELVFEITASPVKDRAGAITGIIGIAQNVTEQYRLERQLRHTQKMEAIGTLAGGVAHDFNNILTPIMGYAEIIRLKMKQDGLAEGAVFDYLDEILKAAKRAKLLVEQVLTFSRSVEKKEVLQYLHPIVKEVLKLMRSTLPSTIVIQENIDEHCGRVLIDPVQLHQVLINLCTNAADAMAGRHGVMNVRLGLAPQTGDGKDWLELTIADSGCGISEEHLERIFEPYFTTKEKTSGTGMGLAMVHGIISRQGGFIKVESEVGKGTTFRVYLPVAQKEQSSDHVLSLSDLQTGSGRILLVDDEEQVVQVTGAILRSLGYEVVGTSSPRQALQTFGEQADDFDMLITDLTMAELTGLELSAQVKNLRPGLPIILITGYSEQVSKEAAVQSGIAEYCMKPISMRELSTVVGKFLGSGSPPTNLQR